jgi:hypothetical protein
MKMWATLTLGRSEVVEGSEPSRALKKKETRALLTCPGDQLGSHIVRKSGPRP